MDIETVTKLVEADYEVRLRGAELGYLLMLLSDEQNRINKLIAKDALDADVKMMALANSVVGNSVLHEAYRLAGAEFIAAAAGGTVEAIKAIMGSETEEQAKAVMERNNSTLN